MLDWIPGNGLAAFAKRGFIASAYRASSPFLCLIESFSSLRERHKYIYARPGQGHGFSTQALYDLKPVAAYYCFLIYFSDFG